MFHLVDILWLGALGLGTTGYVINGRRRMMFARLGSTTLYAAYMMAIGAYAGMIACSIAWLGIVVQAACPDHMLARTVKLRLSVAVSLAVAAILTCARNASDLLPLLAVVNARLVEVQSCQQRIRLGLLLSQILWFGYNIINHHYFLIVGDVIGLTINMVAIYRNEKKQSRLLRLFVRT